MADTESSSVSDQGDTDLSDAYDTGNNVAKQYVLPAKVGLAFAVVIGVGFVLRMVFENQLGQSFGAILIWFSVIFAALGAIGWIGYLVLGAVQRTQQGV